MADEKKPLDASSSEYYDEAYFTGVSKKTVIDPATGKPAIDPATGKVKLWSYDGTDWSANAHIVNHLQDIFNGELGSIIDIGCGQGSFVDYVLRSGVKGRGYDFSQFAVDNPHHYAKGNVFRLDVTEGIPELDDSYDLLFSSDLLEHLRKSKADFVIKEFKRVTRKWVFLQFPVVDVPDHIFDYEKYENVPDSEKPSALWTNFMMAGHLNMEQRSWWAALFVNNGLKIRDDLVKNFYDVFNENAHSTIIKNWNNVFVLEK